MTRRVIRLSDFPELHLQSREMMQGVKDGESRVFNQGGCITRIENINGREKARPLSLDGLRHEISKNCKCIISRQKRDGSFFDAEVFPPRDAGKDAMAAGGSFFDPLNGIINHPTIISDGTILFGKGYNIETGLYIDAENIFVTIPENPTQEEITKARETILEIICDFPFGDSSSIAGSVALFLTILLRPLIDGTVPIFAILAPAPGTGKSLLIQAIYCAVCGEIPAMMGETRDSDEMQKTLLAALLEAPELLVIDNISSKVDSGVLASIVTAGRLRGRILGRSEVVDVLVRALIIFTFNNPIMSNEIARRSVPIKLESNTACPWTRTGFKHDDLIGYIKQNRSEIIAAGLTLGKAWINAGRPKGKGRPLGSFETWYSVIGGILEVAGIPGLLENAADFYSSSDVETAAWTAFLTEWKKSIPCGGASSRDLIELALRCEVIDEGRTERATQISLGRALVKMQGRVFGTLKIKKLGVVSGLQFWGIVDVK